MLSTCRSELKSTFHVTNIPAEVLPCDKKDAVALASAGRTLQNLNLKTPGVLRRWPGPEHAMQQSHKTKTPTLHQQHLEVDLNTTPMYTNARLAAPAAAVHTAR